MTLRRLLVSSGALGVALGLALTALPSRTIGAPASWAGLSPTKQLEARRLAEEPMRERKERRERLRELRSLARRMRSGGQSSISTRGHHATPDLPLDEAPLARANSSRRAQRTATTGPPRPNKRVNDPTGDAASDGQCETSLVASGNNMLASWNDGTGFSNGTNQTQGWAFSTDGGLTWSDQGTFPLPAGFPNWTWTSDPVMAVNPTTGAFYYSGLADPRGPVGNLSGIGVIKGRFSGGTFTWDPPTIVDTVLNATNFLDKQWIAVNPTNHRVYVSYTTFPATGSEIHFQSADSALTTWSSPTLVSAVSERGLVQGSRPIAAPNGDVYVMYYLIGPVDKDFYRVLKSTNGGVTFPSGGQIGFFSNFGSGAPGFNRATGIQFASMAVDRSGGAHNGRLYLTYAESLNWYDDEPNLGSGTVKAEIEPNNLSTTATPFTPGQVLNGAIGSTSDLDYWSVALTAGQTFLVECDSVQSSANFTERLFATNGTTRLCFTTVSSSDLGFGLKPGWLFTAPATGTYFLRMAYNGGTGTYRLKTGFANRASEPAADQRDVMSAFSDNGGATWSTPVHVDTAPVGYDGWLPEIAVSSDGHVYCSWFDWRDASAGSNGGESNIYLARSDNSGVSWTQLGATSDATSAWTSVATNIQPNEGDYQSLFANNNGVYSCWSDGRDGNPNVYMSAWTLGETPVALALVSSNAFPDRIELTWSVDAPAGFTATVYRRDSGTSAWNALGSVTPDGSGRLAWTDSNVQTGATYDYRLGTLEAGTEQFYGQTTIAVPNGLALALEGVHPNPAARGARVSFTLPVGERALLTVVDIGGRVIDSQEVGGLGAGRHEVLLAAGRPLAPGVYLVRLEQRDRTLTSRVSIVR